MERFEMSVVSCQLSVARSEERGARSEGLSFRLPPSAFPLRRAMTLTEVLISMGILTLGLLGVAAIFPVGGWYMQKATIADNGSALAQAVMSDVVAGGVINPKSWMVMVPQGGPTGNPPPANLVNSFFFGI